MLKCLAACLGVVLLWFVLAYVLGSIPVNRDWQEPEHGVEIWLVDNGVHTDFVLPARNQQMDWHARFLDAHFPESPRGANFLEVGWGDRGFYLEARTWDELKISTAVKALFFLGSSLVHVKWSLKPRPAADCKPVCLRPGEYARLCAFVLESLRRDAKGGLVPVLGKGYGSLDTFYEGVGSYGFTYTCNSWTNEALKRSGVRAALWGPLPSSIMSKFATK